MSVLENAIPVSSPPHTLPPSSPPSAAERATAIFAANRARLEQTQPELARVLPGLPGDLEFVLGRDGSLTGRRGEAGGNGGWMGGCSVPRAAAEQLLKTLNLRGTSACFVAPDQAAQVRIALDQASPPQAIVALLPDLQTLAFLLHCEDFSADLENHRLWFAAGEDWAGMLAELFRRHPGLPLPGQFIRTIVPEAALAERLIQRAQSVFSAETARRQELAASARAGWRASARGTSPRVCVVAPGQFRLWEGAGWALGEVAATAFETARRYDPDVPTSAAPLGLALAAAEADVLLMADKGRGDFAALAPDGVRCVTWCTTPRIPAAMGMTGQDRLLIADEAWKPAAQAAGWRDEQIAVAQWPCLPDGAASEVHPTHPTLAILADTVAIEAEPEMELSSHRLLWQAIDAELRQDPFALGDDALRYLNERRERMNLDAGGFDTPRFLQTLVIPAYQQSLARLLLGAGFPLRLHGAGWERIGEFQAHAAGTIVSRRALHEAAAGAAALVHVWPERFAHEIDSLARPVVRPPGRRRESFVREAKAALAGNTPTAPPQQPLDAELLRTIVLP